MFRLFRYRTYYWRSNFSKWWDSNKNAVDVEKEWTQYMELLVLVIGNWIISWLETDNQCFYIGADNPAVFQYEAYQMLSTNSQMKGDWNDLYNNINTCNIVINYVDQATDLNATRKNENDRWSFRLIRALNHFQAVQLWGDCPIAKEAIFSISSASFWWSI